jgi:DNA modification methylase
MLTPPYILPPAAAAPIAPLTIHGDLPLDQEIERQQRLLIISHHQSWLTHGFHRYPAKFFPELPRWAIKKYSGEGETVLDPMAGSGTVNVECLMAGRSSIAVDVDPFARLLARVKTTPLDLVRLERGYRAIEESLDDFSKRGPAARLSALAHVPEFHYRDTWFQTFILEELGAIRRAIGRVPRAIGEGGDTGQPETRAYVDFFRICLSSIIRDVSNADNNCTRTVVRKRLNKRIYPGMALRLFAKVAGVNMERMREFDRLCPRSVSVHIPPDGDARKLPLADSSVSLAVTSPPYINAVDYPRTHQLEMYLLDLTSPGAPLADAKRVHIGTEVVRASDYRHLHRFDLPALDEQLERLYQCDQRRAYIVYRYFEDMERNFREVQRVLMPGRHYVVVVGNNIIRGEVVPTHQYLMGVGERAGFEIETYFASAVIRHYIKVPRKERIDEDWVLVFKKT